IHDLDHGETALRIELLTPEGLEQLAYLSLFHRLVIGIDHRDEARIGCALHIVLAAQRMQSGAFASDLARDESERNETACVICAVYVLADAHAPEDDRGLR